MLFAHGEAFRRAPLVYDYTGNFPLLMLQRMAVYQAHKLPAAPAPLLSERAFCWGRWSREGARPPPPTRLRVQPAPQEQAGAGLEVWKAVNSGPRLSG